MSKILPNSLPSRIWAAATIVALLFVFSTVSSGFLAWIAKEDAEAINIAGSMRMASYRINYKLASDFKTLESMERSDESLALLKRQKALELSEDMEHRYTLLKKYQSISTNSNTRIDRQIQRIEQQWLQELKPLLLKGDAQNFYTASLSYVQKVDAIVSQLQHRNEKRQNNQQQLQLLILLISILFMWLGVLEIRRNVLGPVRNLVSAKRNFKSGKLDTRVNIGGYSEFKVLGNSFNDMASTIQANHDSLENEIATKTAHLTKANQVLTLLYDFSKRLATNQVSINELNNLIVGFGKILPELELTLCIQSDVVNDKDAIAIHSLNFNELCSTTTCDNCLIKNNTLTKSYPIRHNKTLYGDLKVRLKRLGVSSPTTLQSDIDSGNDTDSDYIPLVDEEKVLKLDTLHSRIDSDNTEPLSLDSDKRLDSDELYIVDNEEAIVALTNLITTAMYLLQKRQQEHQIILLEERATIARELHDSLAQSLSYLKIQVSILEKKLNTTHCTSPEYVPITESITKIKEGLSSAYQHLRDLLVTFRLSLNDDSFDEALHNSANEFAKKGGFDVEIVNQVISLNLSASEQVNVIQIVREALSNICRHAKAASVKISFQYVPNSDDTVLRIADDGVGISHDFDQTHHHGLMIMQERAKSLGGHLTVKENTPKGTIIEANFSPEFFNK